MEDFNLGEEGYSYKIVSVSESVKRTNTHIWIIHYCIRSTPKTLFYLQKQNKNCLIEIISLLLFQMISSSKGLTHSLINSHD
jgi:hypothetical protein